MYVINLLLWDQVGLDKRGGIGPGLLSFSVVLVTGDYVPLGISLMTLHYQGNNLYADVIQDIWSGPEFLA